LVLSSSIDGVREIWAGAVWEAMVRAGDAREEAGTRASDLGEDES